MSNTSTQDEDEKDNDGNEGDQSLDMDVSMSSDTVRSTKRPLEGKQSATFKRKKREAQEDVLLQKAIRCMEKSTSNNDEDKDKHKEDDDEIFGRYVATELRSMDISVKRLTKWKIQSIIFGAHSGPWQAQQHEAYPPYNNLMQRVSTSPSFSSDSSGQYLPQGLD